MAPLAPSVAFISRPAPRLTFVSPSISHSIHFCPPSPTKYSVLISPRMSLGCHHSDEPQFLSLDLCNAFRLRTSSNANVIVKTRKICPAINHCAETFYSDADEPVEPPPAMLPPSGGLPRRGKLEQEGDEERGEEAGQETGGWHWKWKSEEEEEGGSLKKKNTFSNLIFRWGGGSLRSRRSFRRRSLKTLRLASSTLSACSTWCVIIMSPMSSEFIMMRISKQLL